MGEILVGTSGFSFDDWIGEVYPQGTRKQDMLPYYVNNLGFKALEVNYTYYSMPSRRTMESFARRTASDFSFVVKASTPSSWKNSARANSPSSRS